MKTVDEDCLSIFQKNWNIQTVKLNGDNNIVNTPVLNISNFFSGFNAALAMDHAGDWTVNSNIWCTWFVVIYYLRFGFRSRVSRN